MAETTVNPTPAVERANVFEDLADRIVARDAAAKPAEAAPAAAPEKPAAATAETTVDVDTDEKPGAASAGRDDAGRFKSADEPLVRIKGPWGEEILDPRKEQDRARLVEYGQKGRNYQELLAKDDQRVAKRAQEALFDNYRDMGLIGVNPDGTTFWTPKGLRLFKDETEAPPSTAASHEKKPDDAASEVDSLVEKMFVTDDAVEAKQAFLKAVDVLADKRGEAVAKREVERLWREKAGELDAQERKRQEAEANGSLAAKVQGRFKEELAKHPLIAGNPRLSAAARELVRQRTAALEQSGVAGWDAFEQGLLELGLYAQDVESLKHQGVKETAAAAAAQRAAPPATGGGSAPPPAPGKPTFNRRDPFGDEFQSRVVNKLRATT